MYVNIINIYIYILYLSISIMVLQPSPSRSTGERTGLFTVQAAKLFSAAKLPHHQWHQSPVIVGFDHVGLTFPMGLRNGLLRNGISEGLHKLQTDAGPLDVHDEDYQIIQLTGDIYSYMAFSCFRAPLHTTRFTSKVSMCPVVVFVSTFYHQNLTLMGMFDL